MWCYPLPDEYKFCLHVQFVAFLLSVDHRMITIIYCRIDQGIASLTSFHTFPFAHVRYLLIET